MSPREAREAELPEELQDEQIVDLPSREALSIVDPGIFSLGLPQQLPRAPVPPTPATDSAESINPE